MMSATEISKQIRLRKKKMMEDHSDAVKLSGIPEDATDALVIKGHETTDSLNMNEPKERDEDPTLDELRAQVIKPDPAMSEVSADPKQINQPEDGVREKRLAKLRARLGMR